MQAEPPKHVYLTPYTATLVAQKLRNTKYRQVSAGAYLLQDSKCFSETQVP